LFILGIIDMMFMDIVLFFFDDQNDIAALYDNSISKYNYFSHDFHYDDIFYK
jgi:hypothetical protein